MKRRDSQAGQAMAEFAITATMFFALVIFILDGGRILWHYVSLSEASRVCARYAITHGSRSTQPLTLANYNTVLRQQIQRRSPNLNTSDLTILAPQWEDATKQPGTVVTITLQYRVKPFTSLFWRPLAFDLRSRSAMTIQN